MKSNRIDVAIKITSEGAGEPIVVNGGPWVSSVVDVRTQIDAVAGLVNNEQLARFLSFTDDGCLLTLARTLSGRTGNHVSAWIYIPATVLVSGKEVVALMELVEQAILAPVLDMQPLQEACAVDYPSAATRCHAPRGNGCAFRLYGEAELEEILGPQRYQSYYDDYSTIYLFEVAGQLMLKADVEASNLSSRGFDRPLVQAPSQPVEPIVENPENTQPDPIPEKPKRSVPATVSRPRRKPQSVKLPEQQFNVPPASDPLLAWRHRAEGFLAAVVLAALVWAVGQALGGKTDGPVQQPAAADTTVTAAPQPDVIPAEGGETAAEPAEEPAPQETPVGDSEHGYGAAIKYLEGDNWRQFEMEEYPDLQGLFDDMNNYRLDKLTGTWKEKLAESENFQKVVDAAARCRSNHWQPAFGSHNPTYNKPDDLIINVTNYCNWIDQKHVNKPTPPTPPVRNDDGGNKKGGSGNASV